MGFSTNGCEVHNQKIITQFGEFECQRIFFHRIFKVLLRRKKRWVRKLCLNHCINFLTIQKIKSDSINDFHVRCLQGNFFFDFAISASNGLSCGILSVQDKIMFLKQWVVTFDHLLIMEGVWLINRLDNWVGFRVDELVGQNTLTQPNPHNIWVSRL